LELSVGRNLKLGAGLSHNNQDLIETTLKNKMDLFAWSITYLLGVNSQIVVHKLSIYREARYVSKKKRKLGEERRLIAKLEATKLLVVKFIVEAHYTTWLANVALIKKSNSK